MDSVITTIHECMQRGERPLSLVDLVEKDLVTLNQASWLVSRIEAGSSWLTGAIPSHAGKTTLSSALLVFLPAQEQVALAHPSQSWDSCAQDCCVMAEEISGHGRGGYLWDDAVRRFTAIPAQGGRIAATIHATTLAQVREQVAQECAAGENGVASFGMFIPIEVEYAPEDDVPTHGRRHHHRQITSRIVEVIHYHEGGEWQTIDREVALTVRQEAISKFLRKCLETDIRSVEALRMAWLAEG
jgi:hypothetical protein